MIGAVAQLRARFRDQFTPVERGWIYRSRGRGPALPLGDEDYVVLVAGFDRFTRWLAWLAIAASMAIWGVIDWYDLHPDHWAVAIPFVAAVCGLGWWAWAAPLRLLDGRAPVAPALSSGVAWRDNMRTLPWGVPVGGATLSILLAARAAWSVDPWSQINRGHYGWAAALLAFFVVMAVAKRRAG